MTLAFADILQQCREAVLSDPEWLGFEAHRALLDDALADALAWQTLRSNGLPRDKLATWSREVGGVTGGEPRVPQRRSASSRAVPARFPPVRARTRADRGGSRSMRRPDT